MNTNAGSSIPEDEYSKESQGQTITETLTNKDFRERGQHLYNQKKGDKKASYGGNSPQEAVSSTQTTDKIFEDAKADRQGVSVNKNAAGEREYSENTSSYTSDSSGEGMNYAALLRNLSSTLGNQTYNVASQSPNLVNLLANALQAGGFGGGHGADFVPAQNMQASSAHNAANSLPRGVQQIIKTDLAKIDSILGSGAMTQEQGNALKNEILQNAYKSVSDNASSTKNYSTQDFYTAQQQAAQSVPPQENADESDVRQSVSEFANSQSDFFSKTEARKQLKTYLEETLESISSDEAEKITALAEALENHAIENYKAVSAHEKNISENNRLAKNRLATDSGKQKQSNVDSQHIFTRAEIGAMTREQWRKNRAEILRQSNKGLIK